MQENQISRASIRFPADVKKWLTQKAKSEFTSSNYLVVKAVREMMERAKPRAKGDKK